MDWKDVFGMVIAVSSVLITVMTVIVAWHLSRNYLQSVKEVQEIRAASDALQAQVQALTDVNSTLLRESMLAVRTSFDLMMCMERRNSFEHLRADLMTRREWKGRQVSEAEAKAYDGRIKAEVEKVSREIAAREKELYWLVGHNTEKAAHLHALTTTNGDHRTIELIESVRASRTKQDERDELLVAMASLRQRLGRPSRSPRRSYDSGTWTGRT